MKIYQTDTSKKKGIYHIYKDNNDRVYHSLCVSGAYYVGGFHNNKPVIRPELINYTEDYSDKLCPACVLQAYKNGMIKISKMENNNG